MTLFATILTLKGRGTLRINTWHPPAEFTPLSPFLLFRLMNSTASFQNEPHTWLCMKSSKRLTASANSSIAKAGKGLNIQNLWCFLVFTEAQLCFFSILKSNMTQQVQYSSTGWFVLLDRPPHRSWDKGKSYACLKILLTTVWSQHTKQQLSHKRKCPNKVDS